MKLSLPILEKIDQRIMDVFFFLFLIFSFHYLYLWWSGLEFYPLKVQVNQLFDQASSILFNQSVWILDHLTSITFHTREQTIYVMSNDGQTGYVEVSPGCTSLKQWLHWIFLITLLPGPVKHKAWYIPLGIMVLHLVNVIRITGLSISLVYLPTYFDFFHDAFFKVMFYATIFFLWLLWVIKFKRS